MSDVLMMQTINCNHHIMDQCTACSAQCPFPIHATAVHCKVAASLTRGWKFMTNLRGLLITSMAWRFSILHWRNPMQHGILYRTAPRVSLIFLLLPQFAHVYTSDSCLVCCLLLDPGRRRRHTPIIFCGTIPGSEFRKIKLKNFEPRQSIKKKAST